jgi:hypothetical protein
MYGFILEKLMNFFENTTTGYPSTIGSSGESSPDNQNFLDP